MRGQCGLEETETGLFREQLRSHPSHHPSSYTDTLTHTQVFIMWVGDWNKLLKHSSTLLWFNCPLVLGQSLIIFETLLAYYLETF